MSWHEFVFAEKKPIRFLRHVVFWITWWFYFFAAKYLLLQPPVRPKIPDNLKITERGKPHYLTPDVLDIIQSVLILSIQMAACYILIYFLLPRYLLKAKYVLFASAIFFLGIALILSTQFINTGIVPFLETTFFSRPVSLKTTYWASISTGAIDAIKIMAAAVAIKLIKHWHLKQKEKERLEKEKIETELQLLKAQIHPSFLFSTLNNIYSFSLKASAKAPEMLLKLSDILSYMLYDCSDREVALEKEIKMLKDYMALEKIRYDDKLEMNIQVKGDTHKEKIAPLLLIRFIENSFSQCNNRMTEQPWINLAIDIENHVLYMKLMNGKSSMSTLTKQDDDNNLTQAKRRLELLYPNNHELVIIEDPEIMMINLEITLMAGIGTTESLARKKELI